MNNNKAFTLIEIMVAVTILAFICAISYGIVLHTLESKDTVERHRSIASIGISILERIRRDLEALYTGDISDPFAGTDNDTADRIDFVCTTPSFPDEDGKRTHLIEVGYQLKENPDVFDYYLLLRRESRDVEGSPLQGGILRVLYDKVKSFNIQFYDGSEWFDSWSFKEQKGLPHAVKIELVIGVEQSHPEKDETEQTSPEETKRMRDGYFSTIVSMPFAEDYKAKPQEE